MSINIGATAASALLSNVISSTYGSASKQTIDSSVQSLIWELGGGVEVRSLSERDMLIYLISLLVVRLQSELDQAGVR